MTVIVTQHARERILTRVGCRPWKVQKVAEKAWRGREPESRRVFQKQRARPDAVYRELMGYIFAFRVSGDKVILSTVLSNTHQPKIRPD